ncbi:MAG: UDP-N-acetylmuramoyl-tripeptide--D-alanyl-D-alanine ligase [Solibacillus sp.]
MQPVHCKTIRQVVKGVLIRGSEDVVITHAIDYKRHELTKPNTLVFVRRSEVIDWQELQAKAPVVVLTDKPEQELMQAPIGVSVYKVRSTLQAYWQFVTFYREQFSIPVVAVTGTCGKTTTKEMLKYVLEKDQLVQASFSSKNEPRQSLPYLLGITNDTKAAIFELGLGNSGNILHQCMVYKPTIGIVTNIGVHHLDGCGDEAGYIKAKAEILEGLAQDGTLILNADDARTKKMPLSVFKGRVVTFGIQSGMIRASDIQYTKRGMQFKVHADRTYNAFIQSFGEHEVYNALATLAAIQVMGLSLQKAILRLRTFKPLAHHLQFVKGINGSTIIDDTWTTNPTSIEAALNVVQATSTGKKVIVVLGDINRLGRFERKYHQEVGTLLASQHVSMLITVGKKAQEIARQAVMDGLQAEVLKQQTYDELAALIRPKLDANTVVLIKGPMSSRGMKELVTALTHKKGLIQKGDF